MGPSPLSRQPSAGPPGTGAGLLGTRLRHLLELLEADIAAVYRDLGLPGFRPRFTPVILALAQAGPRTIGELAVATGVSHSAASQTVARMVTAGWALSRRGEDARQRVIALTPEAERQLPVLRREWEATNQAATELEAELSFPLSKLVDEALRAQSRNPMRLRIAALTSEGAETSPD